MKYLYRTLLFTITLTSLISITACNNEPDDKEIKTSVDKQLQEDSKYKNVQATVSNGVVTLSGDCEGENCAGEIAGKIKENNDIDSVQNNIRQMGTETDLTLRSSIQTIISKYNGVQADVASGVVVLRGNINRDQLQPLMNEISNLQPKKIDNQMVVN